MDFLKESTNYILNGRITPILDDYTSVSTKGKAVVDYGVMPVDCIDVCTMCQVHVTGEVINRLKVQNELSETCKAPDHSLLRLYTSKYMDIRAAEKENLENPEVSVHGDNNNVQTCRKYEVSNIPNTFMNGEDIRRALADTIVRLEREVKS